MAVVGARSVACVFVVFILLVKRFGFCWAGGQYLDCYSCGNDDPIPWNCSATNNETHAITVCVIPPAVADKCNKAVIDRWTYDPEEVDACSIKSHVRRDLNNSVMSNSFVAELQENIDLRKNVEVADECIIQLQSFEELTEKQSRGDTFACYCRKDYCNSKFTMLISMLDEKPPPPTDVNATASNPGTYDPVGNSYIAAIILGVVLLSLLVATVLLWFLLVIRLRLRRKQQELLVPGQQGNTESSHEVSSSDVEVESIQE